MSDKLFRIYMWVNKDNVIEKKVDEWEIKGGDHNDSLFVEKVIGTDHQVITRTVSKQTLQGIESKREEGQPLILKSWSSPSKVEATEKEMEAHLTQHELKA